MTKATFINACWTILYGDVIGDLIPRRHHGRLHTAISFSGEIALISGALPSEL